MAVSFFPVASSNHSLRIGRHMVATSQTIAVGDPVELNSSGLIIVATATSAKLAGVAAEACTSAAAGTYIGVYDDPKQVYKCKADNYAQVARSLKGDDVDLVGSTGAFYANLDATSVNVLRVVQIGTDVDPLLTADFPTMDGSAYVFVEIALHEFAS